jgi:hypothetical protein
MQPVIRIADAGRRGQHPASPSGQRSRFARTSTVDIREEFTVLVHVC